MNTLKLFSLLICSIFCWSCSNSTNKTVKSKSFQLSELEKQKIIVEIEKMAELDKKYRNIISLGTLDKEKIKKDKELRETASLEEYVAFTQTIEKTLEKEQIDSLWELQHKLDYQNYNGFKEIIDEYGYPSKERLNVKKDKLFPILLHPPIEIGPQKFLDEMEEVLLPEVREKRMKAESFALFVDNIKAKILNEPQLYGTTKSFNPATMSAGLPEIENIEKTNNARKTIGLEPLKEGEYKTKEK